MTSIFIILSLILFFNSTPSLVNGQTEVIPLVDLIWKTPANSPVGFDYYGQLVFCSRGAGLFGYRDGSVVGSTCTTPGPTIRMRAGSKYLLSLKNEVTNTNTNIHTHGLHISGDGNADNIFRSLSSVSTTCVFYNFDIPFQHAAGTYWYHSHLHGSTNVQVTGGAYGGLIIEDKRDDGSWVDVPAAVNALASFQTWASTNEKYLFFAQHASAVNNVNGRTLASGNKVSLVARQWYRFRISIAVPGGQNTIVTFPSNCQARLMARDGMWLSNVPYPSAPSYTLPAPGRMDVAVQCNITNGQTSQTSSLSWAGQSVSLITSSATPANAGSPFNGIYGATWQPIRFPYMSSMMNAVIQESIAVGGLTNAIKWNAGQQTFSMDTSVAKMVYNAVYQFKLDPSTAHPIHLHVYPMQIVGIWQNNQVVAQNCGPYLLGEFYDTIMYSPSSCVVRFRTVDYAGKVVIHCHRLAHEDQGAMTWIKVEGGPEGEILNPDDDPILCATYS